MLFMSRPAASGRTGDRARNKACALSSNFDGSQCIASYKCMASRNKGAFDKNSVNFMTVRKFNCSVYDPLDLNLSTIDNKCYI